MRLWADATNYRASLFGIRPLDDRPCAAGGFIFPECICTIELPRLLDTGPPDAAVASSRRIGYAPDL